MGLIRTALLHGVQALVGAAPAPGITTLDDDSVSQVLPVVPDLARRSMSPAETGWWIANLDNEHSGADAEKSQIDPYQPAAAVPAGSAFPLVVPATLDVWLLGATLSRFSGTGDLSAGTLQLDPVPRQQAWGIDDVGAAVVTSGELLLAGWIGLDTNTAIDWGKKDGTGLGFYHIGLRLPRNSLLVFRSEADAAAEFRCAVVLGLFPAGLGQDVVT